MALYMYCRTTKDLSDRLRHLLVGITVHFMMKFLRITVELESTMEGSDVELGRNFGRVSIPTGLVQMVSSHKLMSDPIHDHHEVSTLYFPPPTLFGMCLYHGNH